MPHDAGMALSVYLRAECHAKDHSMLMQRRREYDKIVHSTSVPVSRWITKTVEPALV
jgi:clathrin heavy chain